MHAAIGTTDYNCHTMPWQMQHSMSNSSEYRIMATRNVNNMTTCLDHPTPNQVWCTVTWHVCVHACMHDIFCKCVMYVKYVKYVFMFCMLCRLCIICKLCMWIMICIYVQQIVRVLFALHVQLYLCTCQSKHVSE
jgi:hypothetical protein